MSVPPSDPRYRATGYCMIRSAEIQNFRRFGEARLPECRRINVVVGANGSGKTALLEALFLAGAASPEVVFRMRQWRGLDAAVSGTTAAVSEALWRDLFNNLDARKVIAVDLRGDDVHSREFRIFHQPAEQVLPLGANGDTPPQQAPVVFQWRGPYGRNVTVSPVVGPNGVHIPPLPDAPAESFFFHRD